MLQNTDRVMLPLVASQSVLLFPIAAALWIFPLHSAAQDTERTGKQIVDSTCIACHGTGASGAPRIGDRNAWTARSAQGLSSLTKHALDGIRRMPSHGGNPDLSDGEIERAVTYMVNRSGGHWTEPIDRVRLPAERSGDQIVRTQCLKCHEAGAGGAPAIGDRAAWIPRLKEGLDSLVRSAINGHGGMPPRGGMANLTDGEIRGAIIHMFNAGTVAPTSLVAGAVARQDYRIIDGTAIHFGVVPFSVIRDDPRNYPASLSRTTRLAPDQYYVTVALFDANSGQRVTDAVVMARVGTGARSGPEKTLEANTIADVPTYGESFAMAGAGRYTIALRIYRPGTPEAIRTQFDYMHP